jgi:hypothetical protein
VVSGSVFKSRGFGFVVFGCFGADAGFVVFG